MVLMVLAFAKAGRGSKNSQLFVLLSKVQTRIRFSPKVNGSRAWVGSEDGGGVGSGSLTAAPSSTEKVATPVIPPAVAVMVWTPGENTGMEKNDTNFPWPSVVEAGKLDTVMLPALTLVTTALGGKPSPETVTALPDTPISGETVISAPGTEWMAVADRSKPTTRARTVLLDEGAAPAGTWTVIRKRPPASAETTS